MIKIDPQLAISQNKDLIKRILGPANTPRKAQMELRHRLKSSHPVVGKGYRLLDDNEIILEGDDTACVSTLLSLDHFSGWYPVRHDDVEMTVLDNLRLDTDADERVYRRYVGKFCND